MARDVVEHARPFGLAGAVSATDLARVRKVAQQLSTGLVFVDQPTLAKAERRVGRVRSSGAGRARLDLKALASHELIDAVDINAPS